MKQDLFKRARTATAVIAALISGTAFVMEDAAAFQARAQLPPVEAASLSGKALRLPSELPSDPTLLVIAFEREQQSSVDRVIGALTDAGAAGKGFAMLEIPVIENPGAVMRLIIDNGMRAGIPDESKRQMVVTLYVQDRAAWMAAMGLESKNSVYAVAVGRDGRVLRSAPAGSLKDAKAARAFLAAVQSARGR